MRAFVGVLKSVCGTVEKSIFFFVCKCSLCIIHSMISMLLSPPSMMMMIKMHSSIVSAVKWIIAFRCIFVWIFIRCISLVWCQYPIDLELNISVLYAFQSIVDVVIVQTVGTKIKNGFARNIKITTAYRRTTEKITNRQKVGANTQRNNKCNERTRKKKNISK